VSTTRRVVVTGSSGLIGSEAVAFFEARGWSVDGVDNNMRASFFGPDGDTSGNLQRLLSQTWVGAGRTASPCSRRSTSSNGCLAAS
jgi:nucleoside-diphosphate-sugar epimerase